MSTNCEQTDELIQVHRDELFAPSIVVMGLQHHVGEVHLECFQSMAKRQIRIGWIDPSVVIVRPCWMMGPLHLQPELVLADGLECEHPCAIDHVHVFEEEGVGLIVDLVGREAFELDGVVLDEVFAEPHSNKSTRVFEDAHVASSPWAWRVLNWVHVDIGFKHFELDFAVDDAELDLVSLVGAHPQDNYWCWHFVASRVHRRGQVLDVKPILWSCSTKAAGDVALEVKRELMTLI